jgi:hypothetical protein
MSTNRMTDFGLCRIQASLNFCATAQCALSITGMCRRVYTNPSEISEVYFDVLQNDYDVDVDKSWLQQDGARSHTVGTVLCCLSETSGMTVISNRFPEILFGPFLSSDLSPCGSFLFGYLNNQVFIITSHTTGDLKEAILK